MSGSVSSDSPRSVENVASRRAGQHVSTAAPICAITWQIPGDTEDHKQVRSSAAVVRAHACGLAAYQMHAYTQALHLCM